MPPPTFEFYIHKADKTLAANTTEPCLAAQCAITLGEGATIRCGLSTGPTIVLFVCPCYSSHEETPDISVLGHNLTVLAAANECRIRRH